MTIIRSSLLFPWALFSVATFRVIITSDVTTIIPRNHLQHSFRYVISLWPSHWTRNLLNAGAVGNSTAYGRSEGDAGNNEAVNVDCD